MCGWCSESLVGDPRGPAASARIFAQAGWRHGRASWKLLCCPLLLLDLLRRRRRPHRWPGSRAEQQVVGAIGRRREGLRGRQVFSTSRGRERPARQAVLPRLEQTRRWLQRPLPQRQNPQLYELRWCPPERELQVRRQRPGQEGQHQVKVSAGLLHVRSGGPERGSVYPRGAAANRNEPM